MTGRRCKFQDKDCKLRFIRQRSITCCRLGEMNKGRCPYDKTIIAIGYMVDEEQQTLK